MSIKAHSITIGADKMLVKAGQFPKEEDRILFEAEKTSIEEVRK